MSKSNINQAKQLARLSSDCSFLLTHLIRLNNGAILTDSHARNVLRTILAIGQSDKKPMLKANLSGWYGTCKDAKIFQPYTNN